MKQVLQNLRSGETTVAEVPAPAHSGSRVTIHTARTLISAGTEKMLVEFGQAGLIGKAKAQPEKVRQVLEKIRTDGLMPTLDAVFSKLGEPLPLGYCNAGVVTHPGNSHFEVGDRVVSNGPHAEFVSVPPLLCARIPENVTNDQAAFTVLASIGLQGVRLANPTLGETVVVYGLGLIGLITVQLLRANGCRVIGVDINPKRLEMAEEFGAIAVNGTECSDLPKRILSLTEHRGADAVLITASAKTDTIASDSVRMCRRLGRVVLVGVVGLNLKRSDFYEKEISFQVSCSYGPGRYDPSYEEQGQDYPLGFVRWTQQRNFEAILAMLSSGTLDFSRLLTDSFAISDASSAYDKIQSDPSVLGVTLEFDASVKVNQTIQLHATSRQSEPVGGVQIAVIGAGNFTRATLIPALKKTDAKVKYICGRSNGAAVSHIAKQAGATSSTTDTQAVLQDSDVNLVVVTTNHDSHAHLAGQALQAGKHVFVEKPLALTVAQLQELQRLYENATAQQMMIGFNRRYSPHIAKCKKLLADRNAPITANMIMNAGAIPANHWVHDLEKGGGRIIGEACHFIDLFSYICDSPIEQVSAFRVGESEQLRDDKVAINLLTRDGSVASINYFANGSKAFPKEWITLFSDERVLEVNNFRVTRGFGFRGFRKFKTSRQEKGHAQQFSTLIDSLQSQNGEIMSNGDMVNVTLASFAAQTAAVEGRVIRLAEEYPADLTKLYA